MVVNVRKNEMQPNATRFLTNIWWQHVSNARAHAHTYSQERERENKTSSHIVQVYIVLFDHYYYCIRKAIITGFARYGFSAFFCITTLCVLSARPQIDLHCAHCVVWLYFFFFFIESIPFYIFYGCFVLFNFLFICCRCCPFFIFPSLSLSLLYFSMQRQF